MLPAKHSKVEQPILPSVRAGRFQTEALPIFLVVGHNANDPNRGPVNLSIRAELLLHGNFKVSAMVIQPCEIKEALVDELRGLNFLIFDDHRIAIFG